MCILYLHLTEISVFLELNRQTNNKLNKIMTSFCHKFVGWISFMNILRAMSHCIQWICHIAPKTIETFPKNLLNLMKNLLIKIIFTFASFSQPTCYLNIFAQVLKWRNPLSTKIFLLHRRSISLLASQVELKQHNS